MPSLGPVPALSKVYLNPSHLQRSSYECYDFIEKSGEDPVTDEHNESEYNKLGKRLKIYTAEQRYIAGIRLRWMLD